MLRRALRRATTHFKFGLISVLRHARCLATFRFKFRFISVLRRVLRRTTFRLNSVYLAYDIARFVVRNFMLISDLIQVFCCTLCRVMIRFDFNLV